MEAAVMSLIIGVSPNVFFGSLKGRLEVASPAVTSGGAAEHGNLMTP
jgi:hypothetical protein